LKVLLEKAIQSLRFS